MSFSLQTPPYPAAPKFSEIIYICCNFCCLNYTDAVNPISYGTHYVLMCCYSHRTFIRR